MWKIYSQSYLKQNRHSSVSIMAASCLATAFLSFLYCLGYNLWAYESMVGGSTASDMTLLTVFFLALLVMVSLSLMLIIRGTFQQSMNARVRQFGILSSVGATPRQIRTALMQEAFYLSALPIAVGTMLGIVACYGVMEAINHFAAEVAGRQNAVFSYHAAVLAATAVTAIATVLLSAWAPIRKLSRLTPIQAIRNAGGLRLKKRKQAWVLSFLFGVEGEIAGNALKAQKKALRIANLSLLLSFFGFSMMLCFTTLSSISTRHTYFERYRNAWDVMVTVQETDLADITVVQKLHGLPGIREAAIYQKASGTFQLAEDMQSRELLSLGGYETVKGEGEAKAVYLILDDASFLAYCRDQGLEETMDGAIVLNRIWDNVHSNFRYKEYVPLVQETDPDFGVPVAGFTQEPPALREEYPNYALVCYLPLSLWERLPEKPGTLESDSYIRIFTSGDGSLEDLNKIQEEIGPVLSNCETIIENRVQERLANDQMMAGMQWIFGLFCGLLAVIGIANVFSNTISFLRNRKREFAQYMSVGMTQEQMKKVFRIEAFVIAGKPLLITLPLTVLFVEAAASASYLDSAEFWAEAPVVPILIFAAAIAGFVALAYKLGGRSLMQCDLNETLRNDTLM